MLLKYSQAQKRMKLAGTGKPQRATGMMKLTSTMMNVVPRIHRKVIKNVAGKRLNSTHHRIPAASKRHELRAITAVPIDPCDNSNDSGLGFDQHIDYPIPPQQPVLRFADQEVCWSEGIPSLKRQRIDIKLESDDANDNFSFPRNLPQNQAASLPLCLPARPVVSPPPSLTTQLNPTSRDGRVHLQIVCQPEQQHRARYQTEGSRGAVKDRSGSGFPVVKLVGYDKPAAIQVFIGTDQGRVVPHMFYQACRVSGKNSTPCNEKKIAGTVVIEIEALPDRDMTVTCDCVGILKERNVDVEHRFPDESPGRSKKKSTRCRMVFRTCIVLNDGSTETLQATSHPIVCTQPPGIPEIGKKSLVACPASGGLELFIFGKNFLKDTKVVFQLEEGDEHWESTVQPDKEFLQQSHLVCVVPSYKHKDIQTPIRVQLMVTSSGKSSEPHDFTYTPSSRDYNLFPVPIQQVPAVPCDETCVTSNPSLSGSSQVHPVMLWPSPANTVQSCTSTVAADEKMPPPSSSLVPLAVRRSSVQLIIPEAIPREELKQEASESPRSSPTPKSPSGPVPDLSTTQSPSMATLRQFVSESSSLPSISVENYLTGIEVSPVESTNMSSYVPKDLQVKSQIISDEVSHTSPSRIHSPPVMSDCTRVSDIVHSQIISDLPQQRSASQMHSSSMISGCNNVSDLVSSQIMNDISAQPSTSQLHSPSIISNCGVVPSPVKQARYSGSLLPNVPVTIENSIAPSGSRMIIDSDSAMPFAQPLESNTNVSITASHCINEILSSSSPSVVLQQQSTPSLINESQNLRISELVSSSMAPATTTERLDALVNSAVESHMSPGQSSLSLPPPALALADVRSRISCEASHINPLLQGVESSCPSTTIASTSLCSLLTGPPISSLKQPPQTTVTQTHLPSTISSSSRMVDLIGPQTISSSILATSVNMETDDLPSVSSGYSERQSFATPQEIRVSLLADVEKPKVKEEFMLMNMTATAQCTVPSTHPQPGPVVVSGAGLTTVTAATSGLDTANAASVKKSEEGIPLGSGIQELTQMSEHDLISYINPSCFDQVE